MMKREIERREERQLGIKTIQVSQHINTLNYNEGVQFFFMFWSYELFLAIIEFLTFFFFFFFFFFWISYCRTITVGSQTYSTGGNDIRVLQALWHPYSDTHLGILSSDSVFR